jgi:hypothetical protein
MFHGFGEIDSLRIVDLDFEHAIDRHHDHCNQFSDVVRIQNGERGPRRVDAPRLQELTQAAPAQTGIIPESRSCLGDPPPVFVVHIAAQPSRDVHIHSRTLAHVGVFGVES